jgi:uncharacterized protein YjiS (DUF1127 family)
MEAVMTDNPDSSHDPDAVMWRVEHFADRLARAVFGLASAVGAAAQRCYRREALVQELGRMPDSDLADLGIARWQIPALSHSQEAPLLLQRMLARLGISEAGLAGKAELRRRLERECAVCVSRRQCRRWLRRGLPADGYKAFCPNMDDLQSLLPSA